MRLPVALDKSEGRLALVTLGAPLTSQTSCSFSGAPATSGGKELGRIQICP